jgi:hypothetical protein
MSVTFQKKMTEGGPSSSQEETNERRLWIGNLDIRVTE